MNPRQQAVPERRMSAKHTMIEALPDMQRRSLHLRLFEHREGRIAQFQCLFAIKKTNAHPSTMGSPPESGAIIVLTAREEGPQTTNDTRANADLGNAIT